MSPSAYHRPTYRRRGRSPFVILLAVLLFLAGAAILAFFAFRALHSPEGAALPTPTPSASAPAVSAPPDEPSPRLPSIDEAPWYLTLANGAHPLPADWEIDTTTLTSGREVDSRIFDALTAMLNDCKAQGLSPIVCSAYRTVSRQQELFDEKCSELMADGLSYSEAKSAAATIVAIPGTSEHNLGLSVDICSMDYQLLDDAQADTAEQKWLMEHCVEYGFILRYPKGKEELTGIIWEPWHYRYVGVEAAKAITESGLCLEEYLALFYDGV